MPSTYASEALRSHSLPHQAAVRARPAALTTLVYRSQAVQPLSGTELHWLTRVAQQRNRAEGITGIIVYDKEVFYQWLEGPPDSIRRVMQSIRNDPRHRRVEILHEQIGAARQFDNWPMKLATPDALGAPWPLDVIEAPAAVLAGLHKNPAAAPDLLRALGNPGPQSWHAQPDDLPDAPRDLPDIETLVRSMVVPRLAARHGHTPLACGGALARQLAVLLIAPDSGPAFAMLSRLHHDGAHEGAPLPAIAEPAARALGDLWLDDECSEFDVTIGLTRLQTAMRMLDGHLLPGHGPKAPPTVLIAPEPGERHMLGAALDTDALWHAGWSPHCEFPASDAALQTMLGETWFDALDLSLSLAFRREHWLPRVTETIARAREASQNPGLVVIVGGRAFAELSNAATLVGANAVSPGARDVDEVILRELGALN